MGLHKVTSDGSLYVGHLRNIKIWQTFLIILSVIIDSKHKIFVLLLHILENLDTALIYQYLLMNEFIIKDLHIFTIVVSLYFNYIGQLSPY